MALVANNQWNHMPSDDCDSDSDDDYWGEYDNVDRQVAPFTDKLCPKGSSADFAADFSSARQSTCSTAMPDLHDCDVRTALSDEETAGFLGEPTESLGPGCKAFISGHSFNVEECLGQGSFGRVWAAVGSTGEKDVAIKEIFCRSALALKNAEDEIAILRRVPSAALGSPAQMPALVASATECLGPSAWRARIAMHRVPGRPLLDVLEGGWPVQASGENVGPHEHVVEACRQTYNFLSQLVPALARISAVALHRDAHTRNILVDGLGCERMPSFGLIDFGLAVDAAEWRRGDWKQRGVAGDSRYWPAAAWLMFEHGPQTVRQSEEACSEYVESLDHQSVGLSALHVFVSVLSARLGDCARRSISDPIIAELEKVQDAWISYWQYASRLAEQIFDAYSSHGHADHVKAELAEASAHGTIGAHFRSIRSRLSGLRTELQRKAAAPTAGQDSLLQAVPLLDTLLVLISAPSVGTGHVKAPPAWQHVNSILDGSAALK